MDTLDSLTPDQRETLEQFQSVTQTEDLDASFSRLSHYNWSLERAVASVYEANSSHDALRKEMEQDVASSAQSSRPRSSSPPPPSSSSTTPPPPPTSNTTTATATNATPRTTPAYTRSTQPQSRLWSLFAWPFGFAWRMTWVILSFASRIISRPSITAGATRSAPQRQDPRAAAARFLREFESKYGETHVDFYQGGYSQALDLARRDLKFFLVILQSDEHDDTAPFCRDTLVANELIDFVNQNNILVWAGNVRDSEAYQVSGTLQATTYPFMAIIALQNAGAASGGSLKMAVVDRIEGPVSPTTVVRRFETVLQQYGPTLNGLRLEREQREMERRLRKEQDQAYRESLRADQEKERKAQEAREQAAREAEEARRAEEERQLLAEKRQQYIRHLCRELPAEPDSSYTGDVAKISFRLADGERVIRKFKGEESLEALYRFVEAYPILKTNENVEDAEAPEGYTHKYGFTIISPYPRTVYGADGSRTLADEKSLWPSATLIVDIEDDDDDEE